MVVAFASGFKLYQFKNIMTYYLNYGFMSIYRNKRGILRIVASKETTNDI